MCRQPETRSNNIAKSSTYDKEEETRPLLISFVPGPMDVICSRGKSSFKHPGNCQYRKIIKLYLPQYSVAKTKSDKSLIVSDTINLIREGSSSGIGFVKRMKDGRWYEVDESVVREKIGQSFRDLLHNKYSSSSKAKQIRRKNNKEHSKSSTSYREKTLESLSAPFSCSNVMPINHETQEQETNKVVNGERCSELNNNPNKARKMIDEKSMNLTWLTSYGDDDEPLPIDEERFYAFPIVSLDSSSFTLDESSSYRKELLDVMDTLISNNETKIEKEEVHTKEGIELTPSVFSLSLSSEPIPIDQPSFITEPICDESMSYKLLTSLWDREGDATNSISNETPWPHMLQH